MSDELKPCPFCGGAAANHSDGLGAYWIQCGACWARTSGDDCVPDCIAAWNTRADDGAQATIDVLRGAGCEEDGDVRYAAGHARRGRHGFDRHWSRMTRLGLLADAMMATTGSRLLLLVMIGGGSFFMGWLCHRPPQPPAVEAHHEVQAQQQARVDTSTSSAGKVTIVQGPERIVYRTFACQDGKLSSERIEEKGAAREVATTQAAQVQHAEVRTQVVERDRVVTVPPPRWTASALVGVDGLRTTPNVYGGELTYRLGVFRFGGAVTNRAVMGVVGVTF